MKTLCYLRPYNKNQLLTISKNLRPKDDIKIFSEHPLVDQTGLPKLYYQNLNFFFNTSGHKDFNKKEINEIILRCRLLRNIEKKKALKHLTAMSFAIKEVLEIEKPNYLILQTVDHYISDLMYHYCKKKNIKFIGIVTTPFNNYFRVTSKGEATFNKKTKNKIHKKLFKDYLDKKYIPIFNKKSISSPIKSVFTRWLKNSFSIIFFYSKRIIYLDYYNFHYWAMYLIAKKNFNFFFPNDIGNKNWKKKLNSKNLYNLYIPLQMYPEATIDYACDDIKYVDYYKNLLLFIKKNYKNYNIFIKEHPNVMGLRPSSFYKSLKNNNKITVIPTYENSNYILSKIDCTLVWTGTVGFDSLIRGIPVVSFCKPYYAEGKRFMTIKQDTPINLIYRHIKRFNKKKIFKSEQLEIFKFVSKQLYEGNYKLHSDWSNKNPQDIKDVKKMASSCKHLFNY
jgi:hypothetical protein